MKPATIITTTIILLSSIFSVKAMATVDMAMRDAMIAHTIPTSEYTQEHALEDLDLLIKRLQENAEKMKEAAEAINRLQTIINNKENCQ